MSEEFIKHQDSAKEGANNNILPFSPGIEKIRAKNDLSKSVDKFFADQPPIEYYEDVYDEFEEKSEPSNELYTSHSIIESTVDQLLADKLNKYRDELDSTVLNKIVPFGRKSKKPKNN